MLIVSHNGNPIIKKYRDKILKKLELFFESKCWRDMYKTSKFRNIRFKNRTQFILTAAL